MKKLITLCLLSMSSFAFAAPDCGSSGIYIATLCYEVPMLDKLVPAEQGEVRFHGKMADGSSCEITLSRSKSDDGERYSYSMGVEDMNPNTTRITENNCGRYTNSHLDDLYRCYAEKKFKKIAVHGSHENSVVKSTDTEVKLRNSNVIPFWLGYRYVGTASLENSKLTVKASFVQGLYRSAWDSQWNSNMGDVRPSDSMTCVADIP